MGKILFFNIFRIRKSVSKILKASFFGKNLNNGQLSLSLRDGDREKREIEIGPGNYIRK